MAIDGVQWLQWGSRTFPGDLTGDRQSAVVRDAKLQQGLDCDDALWRDTGDTIT